MVKKNNAKTENLTKDKTQKPKTIKKVIKQTDLPKRLTRERKPKNYNIDEKQIELSSLFSPMLASNYDGSQDINNWYMSEKLDGIRCIFSDGVMRSRNGNKFFPPDYFIEKFPKNITFDGELFLDRKSFSETVSIVKKHDAHDGWKKIKYLVFDAPEVKGSFEKRLKFLEKVLSGTDSEYIELHKHEICKDHEILENKMNEVIAIDGEGIILRDPKSMYENRRTKTMLKVKKFHDAEAKVIGTERGTGRLEGLMGAIRVRNEQGIEFKIGSGFNDKERAKPPKIGSVVTYRYFELSKDGVPRFPTFMRLHPEL